MLPLGFRYPDALVAIAAGARYPDIFPWVFVDAKSDIGKLAYLVRHHDGRNLIPFASVTDARKNIACFDGDDTSGDPPVQMLVTSERGKGPAFASFVQWQTAAAGGAARWREYFQSQKWPTSRSFK